MIGKYKKRIMVTLSQQVIDDLKTIGEELERPVSCLVRESIREWLAARDIAKDPPGLKIQSIEEGDNKKKHHKKKKNKK